MGIKRRIAGWWRRLDEGNGMSFRKVGVFLGLAFVAYLLMQWPAQSADWFRSALGGIGDAAGRLAESFRQLVR